MAGKRLGKLQRVRRVFEQRERVAQSELAYRQRAAEEAREKADQLVGFQHEYRERLEQAGREGLTGADLQLWRRFAESLGEVAEVQAQQVGAADNDVDRARDACASAGQRRRSSELLEEAALREEALQANRKEQRVASDQAARRNHKG